LLQLSLQKEGSTLLNDGKEAVNQVKQSRVILFEYSFDPLH